MDVEKYKGVTLQMVKTHPYVYQHFAYMLGYSCEVTDGFIKGKPLKEIYTKINMCDWNNQVATQYKKELERR